MDLHPTCYRHSNREATIRCQRCVRPICTECMNEAAVGFQCPDCVNSGRRETRQAVGPYGGARPAKPALTSQVLIGINALVWVAIMVTGRSASVLMQKLALTPRGICLSAADPTLYVDGLTKSACQALGAKMTWGDGVASGAVWQVLTSAFTHVEVWHIAFNMMALWFLGPQLELMLGRARFLALYLGSALTASAFVMWFSDPAGATLGASGAIFGMMGAILVIAYKHHGDVRTILIWLGANALITVVGAGTISWQGHLGGFVGGVAIVAALVYAPRANRALTQWLLVSAIVGLTLVAITLRALQLA